MFHKCFLKLFNLFITKYYKLSQVDNNEDYQFLLESIKILSKYKKVQNIQYYTIYLYSNAKCFYSLLILMKITPKLKF